MAFYHYLIALIHLFTKFANFSKLIVFLFNFSIKNITSELEESVLSLLLTLLS